MPTRYPEIFAALAAPFTGKQVRTRQQAGRTLSYITARVAMNRFDEVLGPENWSDEYTETREGLRCRITITLPDGTRQSKEDGGGAAGMQESDNDEKSAFSDAFKRCAVKWGVGRHLYQDGIPNYATAMAPARGPKQGGDDDRRTAPPSGREGAPPVRETWSQWIGPVVTKANKEWRAAMASEGVDPRYQKEYADLTLEPREVNYICTKMLEAKTLDLLDIAKEGSSDVRDPAKCRRAVMDAFSRHPDRIKQAVEEHIRTKEDEIRAKLGMAELYEDDEADRDPPGVGGYEGTEVAAGTPPPMTQSDVTHNINSNK